MSIRLDRIAFVCALTLGALSVPAQSGDDLFPLIKPEQTRVRARPPRALRQLQRPVNGPPPTVSRPDENREEWRLSLDEAIALALRNSEVIRVLAGTTAVSSGRTIYEPSIANTAIDQELGEFDPVLSANNTWGRNSRAFADPLRETFFGNHGNTHDFDMTLSQRNLAGGSAEFGVNNRWSRTSARALLNPRAILNPRNEPGLEVSYTQPLLRGAGVAANRVPIVLARIDTERSYFQFKDAMQELVRSVVQGYWELVFARTDLWARERQVEQSTWAFERAEARLNAGLGSIADVAQPKLALANFRANLITARASLLNREAALKNLLNIPPNDNTQIVPITPPTRDQLAFDWERLVRVAEIERPDLIELKLILDADQQRLIQSRNLARPGLDAVALHRWDGLEGRLASGNRIASGVAESPSWTLGINFSVPVGLRAARATVRSTELLLARDRANLQQGYHAAVHDLAETLRNLDQEYAQYEAFLITRDAATDNLLVQAARVGADLAIFLDVLQAITDWGNAVSSEARSLTRYNTQLATLELQTGTILETHGVRFMEELYQSIGPLGEHGDCKLYSRDLRPSDNQPRYKDEDRPAEESFNLDDYPRRSDIIRREQRGRDGRNLQPPPERPDRMNRDSRPPAPTPDRSGMPTLYRPRTPRELFGG